VTARSVMTGAAELRGFHAFIGPDRAGRLLRVHALEQALGAGPLDRHELDAAASSGADLLALCRQRPAQGTARLIVIERAGKLALPTIEALAEHADAIRETACVVFCLDEPLSARAPLAKLPPALLRTETFPERNRPALKPFALIDALGRRESAAAFNALEDQLASGRDALELLGLISWQLQRWALVARCAQEGWSEDQIGQATGVRGWQLQRLQGELDGQPAAVFNALVEACWRIEADVKTGRRLMPVALAELVTLVCGRGVSAEAR